MWPSKISYGISIVLLILQAKSTLSLSDKRLCADPKCQKTISFAKAKIKYSGNENGKISFNINSFIHVKSKSAGSDPSLWGIEVQGRSGYAPKEYILEEKIFVSEKDLKYVVDVENSAIGVPSVQLKPSEVVQEKVQPTEIPHTMPLERKSEDLLTVLNASESDIEPMTAPLTTENAEIVNQSLREMVTPVQKSFEIIDGTTIPIVVDNNPIVDTGNDLNQAATTTTETITKPSLDKVGETSKEATSTDKKVENLNLVEIKVEKSSEVKTQEGEAIQLIEKETIIDDKIKVKREKNEHASKNSNESAEDVKVVSVVQDSPKPTMAVNAEQDKVASKETLEVNTLSSNTEIKSADVSKDSLPETAKSGDISKDSLAEKPDSPKSVSNEAVEPVNDITTEQDKVASKETLGASALSSNTEIKSADVSKDSLAETAKSGDISKDSLAEKSDSPKSVSNEAVEPVNDITTEQDKVASKETLEAIMFSSNTEIKSSDVSKESLAETAKPGDISKDSLAEKPDSPKFASKKEVEPANAITENVVSKQTLEANTLSSNTEIKSTYVSKDKSGDISKDSLAEKPDSAKSLSNDAKDTAENASKDVSDAAPSVVQHELASSSSLKETTLTGLFDIQDVADTNETGTFNDPTLTGSNYDNTDDDDENDDDDEDEEDEEDDNEVGSKNIPLANADTTTKPLHDFTTVAHETIPKLNYLEVEDTDITTPNPKLAVEESTETNVNGAKIQDTITKETSTTESSNEAIGTMAEARDSVSENISNDMQEPNQQTTTVQPDVPYIPTTLPIFQLATPSPIKPEEQQNTHHLYYDNPNDYYRQQSSRLQAESITESAYVEHRTESTTTASTDLKPEQHSLSREESSNINTETDDVLPTASPLQDHNPEIPVFLPKEEKREAGLFTTILGTVNTFVNKLRKEPLESGGEDEELQHILYPGRFVNDKNVQKDEQFCEKLSPHHCPSSKDLPNQQCHYDWSHISMDNFVDIFLAKVFEMRDILSCLAITASSCLLFLFGYYCFCNTSREGALISKLNLLERSLLASHKENAILKDDILKTRSKLTSIEDNSFGSDDMVIDLKKEVENLTAEKNQLQEHVHSLEKELEQAAEAGLELNKIVADLLNNQSGQESMIMNSVEDLQLQFNEQQKTILEINANLAEKSRENSELQLMLAEQNVRFNGEIASLQQDNDELEAEKANLQTRLDELKTEFEEDITKALEGKNVEIKRLQNEIMDIKNRFEDVHTKWKTSLAKIEALEDCLKTMKKDPNVNIGDVINAANVKAELLDLQHQRASLKSLLETEREARQRAESNLKNTISDVDRLKQDFHQSEKDKLEAQTRLEVLSNYFKEKETQLQKELSLKEAIWLKQHGENTSTVERMTAMQDEIQSLKSQNDALRAEIEAQIAAHKAQTGTLENRAHETWLAARQSERRYEEARAEAAALRRRLTELSGVTNSSDPNRSVIDNKMTSAELNNAPSPILPPPLMDTAGSPLLGRLPPPQFLPFMGPPPPPFLNLPPPPFLSSVEMRPAPLGRMMSPPLGRYSPPPAQRERDRSDFYQDDYSDDDDEEDYEDDDYDYDDSPRHRRRRRSGNGSDSWRRDNYSPPPPDRSYRSHSPADSRYNYTTDRDLVSTYETDISPPASPRERGGISGDRSRTGNYAYSPQSTSKATKESTAAAKKSNKAVQNSDSDKSYSSTHKKKKGKSMV